MRRILLLAILLCSCSFRMKHRWENGLSCRCKMKSLAEATCECEPTKISQCSKPKK